MAREYGIDVSHHQGYIHWATVAGASISWCVVKLTQGGHFVDPRGVVNVNGAGAAGLDVATYHFAEPNPPAHGSSFGDTHNAQAQAHQYLAARLRAGDHAEQGPMVLDWEATTSPHRSLTQVDAGWQRDWIATWCAEAYKHTGHQPILYTYPALAAHLAAPADRWPNIGDVDSPRRPGLWLAQWPHHGELKWDIGTAVLGGGDADGNLVLDRPDVPDAVTAAGWEPVWWQWHDQLRVPGVRGLVDADMRPAIPADTG